MYHGAAACHARSHSTESVGEDRGVEVDSQTPRTARNRRPYHSHSPICDLASLTGTYAMSWMLLLMSWRLLYAKMTQDENQSDLLGFALSVLSITLACACYLPLMHVLVLRRHLWSPLLSWWRNGCCPVCGVAPHGGKEKDVGKRWTGKEALRRSRQCSPPSPSKLEQWAMTFPLVVLALIYVIVHFSVPARFVQTKEIVLATARCIYDAVYMLLATFLLVVHSTNALFAAARQRWPCRRQRSFWGFGQGRGPWEAAKRVLGHPSAPGIVAAFVLGTFVLFPYVCWQVAVVWRVDVVAAMRSTVLVHNLDSSEQASSALDFCAAEGGVMSAQKLRHAWVLPLVLPRRFFNFYMGSESCAPEPAVPLAYADATTNTLLVPHLCPCVDREGGRLEPRQRPRVFYERPRLSEMQPERRGAAPFLVSPTLQSGDLLQRELELKYGANSTAGGKDEVVVHRNVRGDIVEVELRVDRLPLHQYIDASAIETPAAKAVMKWWGEAAFQYFAIPLGCSSTITVQCECLGREQLILFPVSLEAKANTPPPRSSPPRNVQVLMLDAVSRPEVLRSLPRFTAWMRLFQAKASSHGFTVVEGRGHTTFGFSTGGNLAPSLAGTSAFIEGGDRETYPNVSFLDKTLFSHVKRTYGDGMRTSLAMGYCHNSLHGVFGAAATSTGSGGSPVEELDRYLYGPMCRSEYSAQESNIRGPYSIQKRCLGGQHVHDVLFDYTKSLLLRHKADRESFFDFSYFIEGHEGSHSVLSQVDDSLVSFLNALTTEVDFFSDPRNVLIMYADHGSHMGPYYLSSEAGRMERTMPFLLFLMHRSVFTDKDVVKRRSLGTTEHLFLQRANGLTTPMDLYLTLAELLGVEDRATVAPSFATAPWPPRSLFDPLEPPRHEVANAQPSRRRRVSSDDVVNTSLRQLERFPLATHWCDFPE